MMFVHDLPMHSIQIGLEWNERGSDYQLCVVRVGLPTTTTQLPGGNDP